MSSQSRVTSFFKPSPETSVSRKNEERESSDHTIKFPAVGVKKRFQESSIRSVSHTLPVSPIKKGCEVLTSDSVSIGNIRKQVVQDIPSKKRSPVHRHEVVAIDMDSSDGTSNLDIDVFPSPQKKKRIARVVKKPLESQISTTPRTSKVFDLSQKKGGLAMRSPNKSSIRDNVPTRMALEEKKNLNREKRSMAPDIEIDAITCSPVHKLKRTHSVSSSQEDSIKDNEGQPRIKRCTVVLENFETNAHSRKQAKDENKSRRKEVVAEKLDFAGKIDAIKMSKTVTVRNPAETSTKTDGASSRLSDKKQPVPPDFVKNLNNVSKVKPVELCDQSTISITQKKPRQEESIITSVDVDKMPLDTISSTHANSQVTQKEGSEIVQRVSQRRILRRSTLHSAEKDGLSITSKITVGLEEINAGAVVAFKQTYQDIETLLDLKLGVIICPDFKKALQTPKRILPNSFHVNFNFFMKRKPVEHIEALRSQHIDCNRYPHAIDLHTVIYGILMEAKEHVVLHRAQELIYTTLGLHPSGDAAMRKYYWSILSRHFDDVDPCSRWENLRSLLEEVLNADGEEAARMYVDPYRSPSKLECNRAALGVIIHVLSEDLRCWISLVTQPSAQLRDRNALPLVARLLWPQTTIPHVNMTCRELIRFHLDALKSSNPLNVSYTGRLVKMMAVVTQLSDLHLPLKIRKPSCHMMNLAREIVLHSDNVIDNSSCSFYSSFGSLELELLLPLTILSRLKPQICIPEGEHLNLTWMLNSFLEIHNQQSREDVVALFRSKPRTEIDAFLTALCTYFKLFGSFKTWFHMRSKYRSSASRSSPIPGQSSTQPLSLNMYSHSFTPSHLMDDLRQTKYLLEAKKESNDGSLYSRLSWR